MSNRIEIDEYPGLPAVGGRRIDRSHVDFERACLVCLMHEQNKPNPDNAVIATLCDAVRLSREYCDVMNRNDAYRAGEQAGMTEAAEIAKVSLYENGRQSEGYYAERKILTARDAKKL